MRERLRSLDVLRGLTVILMVMVNNGAGPEQFEMLNHAKWIGFTPCDLVFPMFLFMVGVSIWLSLGGRRESCTGKIVRRATRMFVIGVALHAWDMVIGGEWQNLLGELRLWGVLERIALCYLVAGLVTQRVQPRQLWKIIVVLLVIYMVMLLLGNGYAEDETNIAVIIDRWLVGPAHLYHKSPVDPEGLLGTIPAVAHTLIGVLVGREITNAQRSISDRLLRLFGVGFGLALAGWLLSYGFPLCKRIWSPSYVLVTCGIGTGLLALLTYVIDVCRHARWTTIPVMWGMNAFALYVLSEMLSPVMWNLGIVDAIYNPLAAVMDIRIASLLYAILMDIIIGIAAWALWRKRLFIKI